MGKKSKSATQTTTNEPWAAAKPYLTDIMSQAQGVYNSGVGSQVFQGQRVADQSAQTQEALSNITADAQNGPSDLTKAGIGYAQGQLATNGINPFIEDAISRSQNDAANQIAARMSGSGRYGSGAMGAAIADRVGNIGAQTRANAFEAQQGRNVGLLGQLGNLEDLRLQPNQRLLAAGGMQDARQQSLIDADREKFQETQDQPWSQLQKYAGLLYPTAGMGGTSTTVSKMPSASPFQQIFGGGLALLGNGDKIAKGWTALAGLLSDERAKENIKPVGLLDNGLKVYAYNYKSGGPTHIGLLAQEVEKKRPEAVTEKGGMKHVFYDLATE